MRMLLQHAAAAVLWAVLLALAGACPAVAGEAEARIAKAGEENREEEAREADDLIVGVYGGWLSAEGFREWFVPPIEMEEHYLAALSLARELARAWKVFTVEAEGIALRHWGPFRGEEQEYLELVAAANLRWKDMPWDRSLDTSLGFGLGVSATSEEPEHERRINGSTDQVLCYMMLDFTVALPERPEWELAFRVHHRSGIWGLIGDVKGGSNYLTLGIRRRF